jgi:hypothetical protein
MFFPTMYTIFSSIIAFAILCIQDKGLDWLKVVLLLLNVGLFGFIIVVNYFKEGEKAYRVRLSNDLERINIINTGEDRPINRNGEYKPWKGFLIAGVACIPLVLIMIAHAIVILFVDADLSAVGGIASFVYMAFFGFFWLDTSLTIPVGMYFLNLIYVPILLALTGVPYIMGAKKIELQQEKIKETHRQIYGE